MKNTKYILTNMVKMIAEASLKRDANQTTCSIIFQPKAPAGLQRFKKAQK